MWSNWLERSPCVRSRPAADDEAPQFASATTRSGDGAADPARVLVVGETVPGLVLTRLLERDGHAPTLVRRRRDAAVSDVTLIPPAVTTVDGLVDGTVDAVPVSEIRVTCDGAARAHAATGFGRTSLLLDRRLVRRRLRRTTDPSNRRTARVDRLRSTGQGVEVAFAGGERATFDLVVGADGPNSFVGFLTGNTHGSDGGIREWAFRVPEPTDWPGGVVESWGGDAVATAAPVDDGIAVRLGVSGAGETAGAGGDVAGEALSALDGRLGNLVDGLPDRASYRRLPDPGAEPRWRAGRVAFCGTAAAPVGRLSGLAPSLGVEDAVALADLLGTASSVPAALDSYAEERAKCLQAVRTAAEDAGHPAPAYRPLQRSGMLGRLAGLRAVGFASVFEGSAPLGEQ